jgi:signal transduction histidine kinase
MSNLVDALLASVPDPIWIVTRGLQVGRCNRGFTTLRENGFDPLAEWWRNLAGRVLAGRSVSADARIVVDGVERTYAVTGTPSDEGAVFLLRDRTGVSRERAIERKGQEWSLTFDAIELPVFITLMDGTIARLNRAARDLAGGDFVDSLGRGIRMADQEPWITLSDIVSAVRDSRTPCSAQINVANAHWDVTANCYRSAAGEEERVIVVMRNATDVVRLQESVRRGEQLAALGELVAGVAHEVRNPIFGMGLTVDALQEILPPDEGVMELFGILRIWLDRLNRLMESLLEYGKTWTLDMSEGKLDDVLSSVLDGCRQIAARSSVTIDAEFDSGLPMLMDANRLGHAFENLINNAIQHSKPEQSVVVRARAIDASTIECLVRDHGPGFEALDMPKVFQPFFTRRRGGTGLGLSIVQRIVDEHGGTIAAGNADDGGAVLTMRFPVYRGPAGSGA